MQTYKTLTRLFAVAALTLAVLAGTQAKAAPAKEGASAKPAAQAAKKAEQPKILQGLEKGTYAYFQTNYGEFVARLFTDKAPVSTANFIGLAEGTKTFINPKTVQEEKKPFYDGLVFHRIIPGFMIQGGDPLGTGTGDPGYKFNDEFNDYRFDKPGILAMANAGPNTNGSQFFITVAPQPGLDQPGHYNIFGEIVRGYDIVEAISKVETAVQDRPVKDVVMQHVKIVRIGADGKPEKPAAAPAKPASKK